MKDCNRDVGMLESKLGSRVICVGDDGAKEVGDGIPSTGSSSFLSKKSSCCCSGCCCCCCCCRKLASKSLPNKSGKGSRKSPDIESGGIFLVGKKKEKKKRGQVLRDSSNSLYSKAFFSCLFFFFNRQVSFRGTRNPRYFPSC